MNRDLIASQGGISSYEPTAEQVDLIKRTVAKGATNDELALFLHQCKTMNLDPLVNQLYFIKRSDKVTMQVGINGLRSIASRAKDYNGQDPIEYGPDITYKTKQVPEWAEARVYKKGIDRPFVHRVYWHEYVPQTNDFMWLKMPKNQLGKCAEAGAFRKGWPDYQLYIEEEMEQGDDFVTNQQKSNRSAEVVTNEFNEPLATESQVKRVYTLATKKNITREQIHLGIQKSYGVSSTKELTREQADELLARLNRAPEREQVNISSDDPETQSELEALEGEVVGEDLTKENL